MAAYTSTQTGNASSGSTWVGGTAPSDGDTITVAAGHTVTQDVNRTYGSNASNVGHGVTINGTSGNSGIFRVAAGVSLTLRGNDKTSNTMMSIAQYGRFEPQPGSTVVGDAAGNYSTQITNNGTISAVGAAGSRITITSPAANYSWANSQSAEAATVTACQDGSVLWRAYGTKSAIANAAGTGPGSFGDGTPTFSSKTPSTILTNEVASLAAIATTGDFYVDYVAGQIWFYQPVATTPSFSLAYKYYTNTQGWGIVATGNTAYNQSIYDYCDFSHMGTTTASNWCLNCKNHYSAAASANRLFKFTNNTVSWCKQFLNLWVATGTAADPILIDNNTFKIVDGTTTGYAIYLAATNSYVNITNNTFAHRNISIIAGAGAAASYTQYNLKIDGNSFVTASALQGAPIAPAFSSSQFTNNTFLGIITASTFRSLQDVGGDASGRMTIANNVFAYSGRMISYCSYVDIYNNLCLRSYHHGFTAATLDDIKLQSIRIYNNLFYGQLATGTAQGTYNASSSVESGYNHRYWIDDIQVVNNTSAHNPNGYFAFGDSQDQGAGMNQTITRAVIVNNLSRTFDNAVTGGASCKRQVNSSSTTNVYVHCLQWDYNSDYNFKTRYSTSTLNRQGTPSQGSGNYNALTIASRNVPGVALFNPSSVFSSQSLVYTYTNATTQTLAWGGGSATSIVYGSGTLTAAPTALTTNSNNTGLLLTDSSQSWVNTYANASCPIGHWIKFTSGAAAGTIGSITWSPSGTTIRMVPYPATLPASGDSYVIIKAEVTLTDSGANTVSAGIYLPDLWPSGSTPTSGTDSGISWADHSVTGSDPLLVNVADATMSTAAAASYKFSSSSPAKDAGTTVSVPTTDYFGTARPQSTAYDLGFFEFPDPASLAAAVVLASDTAAGAITSGAAGITLSAAITLTGISVAGSITCGAGGSPSQIAAAVVMHGDTTAGVITASPSPSSLAASLILQADATAGAWTAGASLSATFASAIALAMDTSTGSLDAGPTISSILVYPDPFQATSALKGQ